MSYVVHVVWNSFTKDGFDRNWNDFIRKYASEAQVALRAVRGSPYMDFSLPGSPFLGRDEKHTKEREHARIVQQVHHTQQLHESIREAIGQLPSNNRGPVSACVYPREVQGSSRTIQRKDNVAPKYILECWSKNIKRRHTHIKSSQDEPLLEPRSKRFDDLVFRSHNICEFASEYERLAGILHQAFDNVMAELQKYQERSKEKSSLSHEEATLSDMNDLQSPPRVRTRGRPKNRLGSNLEKKISNAMKKKKKPAPNELNLLDGGSTIQSSSSFYNAPDMNYPGEDYTSFSFY
ncbi:hypothetical protein Ahy_B07g087289 [Arachis hypogaea]|uniref:Protein FAR1-RELATED SEQUENCE n=1 Tax=Arachis hypogaea TaxID=3818 RepID=A0A444YBQ4_ARAHY|nr:hypothetical protein Ahy_B07g087289 [Arachis hypogaea]